MRGVALRETMEAGTMENREWTCPYCGDTFYLSDVIGCERLNAAVTWQEEQDILEEWHGFQVEHKLATCPK